MDNSEAITWAENLLALEICSDGEKCFLEALLLQLKPAPVFINSWRASCDRDPELIAKYQESKHSYHG